MSLPSPRPRALSPLTVTEVTIRSSLTVGPTGFTRHCLVPLSCFEHTRRPHTFLLCLIKVMCALLKPSPSLPQVHSVFRCSLFFMSLVRHQPRRFNVTWAKQTPSQMHTRRTCPTWQDSHSSIPSAETWSTQRPLPPRPLRSVSQPCRFWSVCRSSRSIQE